MWRVYGQCVGLHFLQVCKVPDEIVCCFAVLAHAYTAPSAAMLPAWSDSPPSAHEGSPLLYPGWADSADGALTAAAASDHSPNSPLPSVSEEEPSVHSMRSGHGGTVRLFAAEHCWRQLLQKCRICVQLCTPCMIPMVVIV